MSLLGIGLAAVVSACTPDRKLPGARDHGGAPARPPSTAHHGNVVTLDSIPPPRAGTPHTIFHAPHHTDQIALTIDDGVCDDCVTAYVQFAESTRIHLTFSPNGTYESKWSPHAEVLRGLIEAGQVQMANHTYSHLDLKQLTDSQVEAELERNDEWIQKTFGITTRPWYRPPFGFHNKRVDTIAGNLGYTNVVMWNGSFGDARLLTPDVLLTQARLYLTPGTIMLGHANHPTITSMFGEIQQLIRDRNLAPVTLDEMFGTSRNGG